MPGGEARRNPVPAILAIAMIFQAHPSWAAGGGEATPEAGAPEPAWMTAAMADMEAGIDAYFEANFEGALPLLDGAMKALLDGRDLYPVRTATIVRDAVFLLLTLHALGLEEDAGSVAEGLSGIASPPWGAGLDLSEESRAFLDGMGAAAPAPASGALIVDMPAGDCSLTIDGEPIVAGGKGRVQVFEGSHWLLASCGGKEGAHHLVDVDAGDTVEVDLSTDAGADPAAEGTAEAGGKADLILDLPSPSAMPWFGDAWNLALETVGLAVLGTAAGLLAGGMRLDIRARTRASLSYSDLESTAMRLDTAGWVLVGTGGLLLAIGVIRMAVMKHSGEAGG